MSNTRRIITAAALAFAATLPLQFQVGCAPKTPPATAPGAAAPRTSPAPSPASSPAPDAALVAKARAIHDRVIKADTHNDISVNNFTPTCNYTMRLTNQVNLPKMIDGDMDVAFLIVYVGQGPLTPEGYDSAYARASGMFDAIHRLTKEIAPDKIGLALTPADVIRLHREGKRVAVIGVENAYPIGLDIKRVEEFYNRGGRYMSMAHNGNSQMADSNTGEAQGYLYNNGLSDLGRQVIAEMNRLGMMIDLSHPSKGANLEAMRLSKAPVIASHSSARAVANHSRNMDDEQLMALKKNGGVIQTVGFASYVKVDSAERVAALAALQVEFGLTAGRGAGGGRAGATPAAGTGTTPAPGAGRAAGAGAPAAAPPPAGRVTGAGANPCPIEDPNAAPAAGRGGGRGGGRGNAALEALSPERRAEYDKKLADINTRLPPAGRANVSDFVDHIDYLVKKIGIDHVGISSDFDGGGGVDGWNSAAEAFNVTLELVKRGYTEQQIGKIWSGNLLRVWTQVEQVAKKLK
jgi:membrane dipeptidase